MARLSDTQKRQLDCLLADFGSVKAEIARRSNLQRVVLAAYVTFLVLVARHMLAGLQWSIPVAGLWVGGSVALLFHEREHLEICRLGGLIRTHVAATASQILGVEATALFPSETALVSQLADCRTRAYDVAFFWTCFLVVPALVTFAAVVARWGLLVTRAYQPQTIGATVAAAVGLLLTLYLLSRH